MPVPVLVVTCFSHHLSMSSPAIYFSFALLFHNSAPGLWLYSYSHRHWAAMHTDLLDERSDAHGRTLDCGKAIHEPTLKASRISDPMHQRGCAPLFTSGPGLGGGEYAHILDSGPANQKPPLRLSRINRWQVSVGTPRTVRRVKAGHIIAVGIARCLAHPGTMWRRARAAFAARPVTS
jgi:hypothetical protein